MNNQNTKIYSMGAFLIAFLVIVLACSPHIKAQTCQPSEAKTGTEPSEQCNTENSSECCVEGRFYETYECSPPVSSSTEATLTLNSFQEGGDGGGELACDGSFHSDETAVVALSTGWYNKGSRCGNFITINGNGRNVQAKVVDECDSTTGCDEEHAFQPPCRNNIVDASKAVWEALGVSQDNQGELEITWSDA